MATNATVTLVVNPYLPNGLSYPYQLDESFFLKKRGAKYIVFDQSLTVVNND